MFPDEGRRVSLLRGLLHPAEVTAGQRETVFAHPVPQSRADGARSHVIRVSRALRCQAGTFGDALS